MFCLSGKRRVISCEVSFRQQLITTKLVSAVYHLLFSCVEETTWEIAVKANWKVIFDYNYDLSTDSLSINVEIARTLQRVIDNQLNYLNK